jgi:putrescine aminotransferase
MYQHPLMEMVEWVPFGDAAALEEALKKGDYMAFFIEPIQGEGGIVVPPAGYLTKVRELCDKYDTLMVADEIQCGCGRSGKLWVCDHEGVVPDVLVYAKGFSGGMIPSGGYICKKDVYEAAYGSEETCWHHTATYQENSLGAAAGLATLQYLYENNLIEAAAEKGEYFMGKLREVQNKYPGIIKEVRGMGLMIGLETCEVPDKYKAGYSTHFADPINNELIDVFRVQVMHTINNPAVFRFLPPLTVSLEDIGYVLKSFEQCVKEAYERINK